jgi:methylmalonyl-CoA/ethylmalonyl-CoA epimerase
MKFHHFGLAVKDFQNAINFYSNMEYDISTSVIDPIQNVELVLCKSDTFPSVELIKPINDKSPINRILLRSNESIYHICYEVKNLKADLDILFQGNHSICISQPKPAILFSNRLVSFYYIADVGTIEILQATN